jgi:hypothetical protein
MTSTAPSRGPQHELDLDAFVEEYRRLVVANASRALAWPAALFVGIALFVGVDIAADLADGVGLVHLTAEIVALVLALAGVVATASKLRRALRDGEHLLGELEATTLELSHWRSSAMKLRSPAAAVAPDATPTA